LQFLGLLVGSLAVVAEAGQFGLEQRKPRLHIGELALQGRGAGLGMGHARFKGADALLLLLQPRLLGLARGIHLLEGLIEQSAGLMLFAGLGHILQLQTLMRFTESKQAMHPAQHRAQHGLALPAMQGVGHEQAVHMHLVAHALGRETDFTEHFDFAEFTAPQAAKVVVQSTRVGSAAKQDAVALVDEIAIGKRQQFGHGVLAAVGQPGHSRRPAWQGRNPGCGRVDGRQSLTRIA